MDKNILIMLIHTLLPFVISPGASFALTLSATSARIPHAALKVWTGTTAGIALLALASALGIAHLVMQYPVLKTLLSVLGGMLLIYWGIRLCLPASHQSPAPVLPARLIGSAFIIVISNIKAILLYVAILPALLTAQHSPFAFYLAALLVHGTLLLIWLLFVSTCLRRLPVPIVQRPLRYASGAFMIWLGGKSLLMMT